MSDIISNDPKVWGPGMWMTLHILSYKHDTLLKAKLFLSILVNLVTNLPCRKCRNHAIEFMNSNDYTPYLSMKGPNDKIIGPFKYVCKMHNNVNIILNNPVIDWLKVYKEYTNINKKCDGPCNDNLNIQSHTPHIYNIFKDKVINNPKVMNNPNVIKEKIMKFVNSKSSKDDFEVVFVTDRQNEFKFK